MKQKINQTFLSFAFGIMQNEASFNIKECNINQDNERDYIKIYHDQDLVDAVL